MAITQKKSVYPPKKRGRFFLGGGNFFWEDLLDSLDHPSIIVGCLKVVWDLSEFFVGPPAGLRRLTAIQKVFDCQKTSKNRGFGTKFGREGGGLVFACSFSFQNLNHNVL